MKFTAHQSPPQPAGIAGEVLQDLFLDEPSHGAEAGGSTLSPCSSLPPLFVAVSSLPGLTRPEERCLSTHAWDRPEAPAEATAATAAAKDREHRAQAAAAAAPQSCPTSSLARLHSPVPPVSNSPNCFLLPLCCYKSSQSCLKRLLKNA